MIVDPLTCARVWLADDALRRGVITELERDQLVAVERTRLRIYDKIRAGAPSSGSPRRFDSGRLHAGNQPKGA